MRILWILLLAALLLPLSSPVSGQAAPAENGTPGTTRLLEDPAGDVVFHLGDQTTSAQGRFVAADVKALDVAESQDDLTFILTVASLQNTPEIPTVESIQYAIEFQHNDRQFRVLLFRGVLQGTFYAARLQAYDSGSNEYYSLTRFGPATADEAAGTLSATFSKDLMVDAQGNAPQPQTPFVGWQVSVFSSGPLSNSRLCFGPGGCQAVSAGQARDQMPDQGRGEVPLQIRFGLIQTGTARLASPVPTRASNGEATTIVYQVTARNLAPSSEMFTLKASGVPSGWDVQLPAEHVTIDGNGMLLFPVVLTMPFTHQHGSYQFFVLTLTGMTDSSSVGRVQLGVRFSNPPQPTGHHNALWFHSSDTTNFFEQLPGGDAVSAAAFGDGARLFMNAQDSDPLDTKKAVAGSTCNLNVGTEGPRFGLCWRIPLSPALEIGLDFDLGKVGKISIPVTTTLPLMGAKLTGELRYFPPPSTGGNDGFVLTDVPMVLAEVRAQGPADIPPASTTPVFLEADLVPVLDEPYVPFAKGASLRLDLNLDFTGVAPFILQSEQTVAFIQPGATITELPLFEYHDRVNQLFAASSQLMLRADTPQDRLVNPGEQVLFNLTLMNHGNETAVVDLQVKGTHEEWAQMLVPTKRQVTLPRDGTAAVAIAVRIPADASADPTSGDMVDLILTATSTTDLGQRALARVHVMVDDSRDWPSDEAAIQAMQGIKAEEKTPGFGLAWASFALVAVALAYRRKKA